MAKKPAAPKSKKKAPVAAQKMPAPKGKSKQSVKAALDQIVEKPKRKHVRTRPIGATAGAGETTAATDAKAKPSMGLGKAKAK